MRNECVCKVSVRIMWNGFDICDYERFLKFSFVMSMKFLYCCFFFLKVVVLVISSLIVWLF